MFLIVYCTFAIAVFFWIFGFVKTAIIIGVLALGLIAYSFIRREVNRRRLLKRRTVTNKSR
ncbi:MULTISPECIES: hypothetical protein [Lactiplantibacillus]|jgi:uncharacterized membrane protein|uniref:Uncharacterized protein n=2 Tax=Lactiplantibacillus pentosus TaxID=1589 RepID=A0A2S9VK62_LACPE|nr:MULTISPECIES: hypothetical protein [Lactiplantibacillus]CCC17859.1 putative uncharacterized protein [Lactiplantibacillus pentosus IG1]BBM22582.1 uncharacterized protein SN13T_2626 [Lactiplantibacillus plantarum]ASG80593.1 hypothetical protein CEW82_12305 [Lactiplantibacillus pentosus]MBQ0837137.1 hypothetical protein [Lactiplantibacillus pentosus]MBU7460061.1 hypothetical protein [Lactiplantibacillus pentosus]